MKTKGFVLWTVLVLALIGLVGLGMVGCKAGLPGGNTVTSIKFVGTFKPAQSILPQGFPLDCVEWRVTSAAGDPSAIDQVFGLSGGVVTGINVGTYNLTVYARNANHDDLGQASTVATVTYGGVTNVALTVSEYTGPGSASGTITWEPNILPSGMPTFTISMVKTSDHSTASMPFVLDPVACSGSGSIASLLPGWWVATGVLADVSGRPSTGFAAAVRIATAHNTLMAIALHALPTSGGLSLSFTWNGTPELQITGSPSPGDLAIYSGQSVPISVTSLETGFTVAWYLDGQQVGTGATFNLDASIMSRLDYYRLDAVAISADGQRASSLTWNINKGSNSPQQVRISGTSYVQNYGPSFNVVYTLRAAAAPNTVIATVTTQAANNAPYAFNGLAAGTYVLQAQIQGYDGSFQWWNAAGVSDQSAGDTITIPQSGSLTFDFPQGF